MTQAKISNNIYNSHSKFQIKDFYTANLEKLLSLYKEKQAFSFPHFKVRLYGIQEM